MKVYAPKYYKKFICIADKCKHSCCIGWEIDIDSDTLEKYKSLEACGGTVLESIEMTEVPHFRLCDEERCPHLKQSGLCSIILEYGEDYLCDICREHPRFYNYTSVGKEVGLGMACEEACRLILSSDEYDIYDEVGIEDGECEISGFDAVKERNEIYKILSMCELGYRDRLSLIYSKYGISPAMLDDSKWKNIFAGLEYLYTDNKKLFACYTSDACRGVGAEKPLERALAYFIYRHCSEAADEYDFRISLGFCLVCEGLLASMYENYCERGIEALARILSEEIEYSEDNIDTIKNALS